MNWIWLLAVLLLIGIAGALLATIWYYHVRNDAAYEKINQAITELEYCYPDESQRRQHYNRGMKLLKEAQSNLKKTDF